MDAAKIIFSVIFYGVFAAAVFMLVRRFLKTDEPASLEPPGKLSRRTVLTIAGIAVASRVVLWLLSWGVTHAFGLGRDLLDTWTHWDANAYISIAETGYYAADEGWIRLVFFPLYPSALWVLNFLTGDGRISGLLVSWVCLAAACVYLYKLVLIGGDTKAARRAVKYLLLFPVGVFLGAPFTESMFLMLSLMCLYYARTGRFAAACAVGGLAALTRSAGVLLAFPVLFEMLFYHGLVPARWRQGTKARLCAMGRDAIKLLMIPAGTIAYLLINHYISGNALEFLVYQREHWHQSFGSYANSLEVSFYRAFIHEDLIRTKLILWGTQFVVMLAAGLTLPVFCRKMRASYGVYALVYVFVVFAPAFLMSGFRYYMGLAVLYPALAMLTRRRWADVALTTLFAALMPVYTFCFSVQWTVF